MSVLQPLVFDASALVALFGGDAAAFSYWRAADRDVLTIVFPAAAMAEANRVLRTGWSGWEALLYPPRVSVSPLDGHAAVEAGLVLVGSVTSGHVVYEARAVQGVVVTAVRSAVYAGTGVPVLPL